MPSGLLSLADLKIRTNVSQLLAEEDSLIQYWLDLGDSIIKTFELDSSVDGYGVNVSFAIQKTVEYLYIDNLEENTLAANSPFKSERIGSYSYTRFSGEKKFSLKDNLPPIVYSILSTYLKTNKPISYTTTVFNDLPYISDGRKIYVDDIERREYDSYINEYNRGYGNVFAT